MAKAAASADSSLVPPEIAEVSFNEPSNPVGVDGKLTLPIVVEKFMRVSMESIHHKDELGVTTIEIDLHTVPPIANGSDRGMTLVWSAGECHTYQDPYGFPQYPVYEGSEDNVIPQMVITQMGVYVHDPRRTYHPQFVHDYDRIYDYYPFTPLIPFGDLDTLWTVKIKREVSGDEATYTVTVTNDHGGSYTVAPFTLPAAIISYFEVGAGWRYADFETFPVGMEIHGGRIVLNDVVGAKPTIDTFTATATVISPTDYGRTWTVPVTVVASASGGKSITGYYWAETATPIPIPLPGTFVEAPTEMATNLTLGNETVPTGLHKYYLWAADDGLAVSDAAEVEVFLCDIALDGVKVQGNFYRGRLTYHTGETALTKYSPNDADPGGVLSMVTPNTEETITWTVSDGPSGNDGALFEIVADTLKFKSAPENESVTSYRITVTAEDESGNTASIVVEICKPGY